MEYFIWSAQPPLQFQLPTGRPEIGTDNIQVNPSSITRTEEFALC